jgi:hypothetical protein
VHIISAACENMIDGKGMRSGDILQAANGKTVEARAFPPPPSSSATAFLGIARMLRLRVLVAIKSSRPPQSGQLTCRDPAWWPMDA